MIDLHAHLLPGIDDGAGSLEEAVAMARLAAEEGCEAIVATPHQRHPRWWNGDGERLRKLRREIQSALGATPKIFSGGEVRVDAEFLSALEKPARDGIEPLAGSCHLLIEFPRDGIGPDPEDMVHELTVLGWLPVVAHPELLPWLARDLARMERLVELGGRLQLTAMSFTGEFGRGPRDAARAILDAGLGHFVASDAHGLSRRPPGLRRAYETIAERWNEALARRLTSENPRAVLEDRPVSA